MKGLKDCAKRKENTNDAGLDFVGFEIDRDYFEKQEERFKAHTAQMNFFIDF